MLTVSRVGEVKNYYEIVLQEQAGKATSSKHAQIQGIILLQNRYR